MTIDILTKIDMGYHNFSYYYYNEKTFIITECYIRENDTNKIIKSDDFDTICKEKDTYFCRFYFSSEIGTDFKLSYGMKIFHKGNEIDANIKIKKIKITK